MEGYVDDCLETDDEEHSGERWRCHSLRSANSTCKEEKLKYVSALLRRDRALLVLSRLRVSALTD